MRKPPPDRSWLKMETMGNPPWMRNAVGLLADITLKFPAIVLLGQVRRLRRRLAR